MIRKRERWLPFAAALVLICADAILSAPRRSTSEKRKHLQPETSHEGTVQLKSYIDIDASDPFKVPKSSQYIDQPVPEFSKSEPREKEKSDEEEEAQSPNRGIDNIQDDLKHLGLENLGGSAPADDDKAKAVDTPDEVPVSSSTAADMQQAGAPPAAEDLGNDNDGVKLLNNDEPAMNGGEPESRQNVTRESGEETHPSNGDEGEGSERNNE